MAIAANQPDITRERILFVTGRLAEGLVRRVVAELSSRAGFDFDIAVAGISVAALMHVDWLKRKLVVQGTFDRIILPGWCQGELRSLEEQFGLPVLRGPKDILDLGDFLNRGEREPPKLDRHDIEIIAEINHAPQLSECEILQQAENYRRAGADVIDVGCVPGNTWPGTASLVRRLIQEGYRVSIDSFNRSEVEAAVGAGAELVLSCNSTNVDWAAQLPAELVVIPDDPAQPETMWETAQRVQAAGGRYRLDPILEPIGFGFAASLARYHQARRHAPDAAILMGIGNLTEMTDVDSAGINVLLAAVCQELRIGSVLTTQVINWCRTAVAEFDLARRLVKYALDHHVPPKRLSPQLVLLRDPDTPELGPDVLRELAGQLQDPNYRIFVERGEIHVMNRDGYWTGTDPFQLFESFSSAAGALDAAHAFYLGYELSKAVTALTLGKHYQQDTALRWGFLTVPEVSPHERRRRRPAPEGNQ